MKNEKKELVKKFKEVIEDLMDHYEEYTDEEKAQINDLNTLFDKYDIELKFDWNEYVIAYSQWFDGMYY